ncbi:MAG: PilZ domain-containing protein [Phycisphaerales bacterium]|nr:PilZ domain-containing protein [Phycisphaerales bacterium]
MRRSSRASERGGPRSPRAADSRPNSVGLKLPALSEFMDGLDAGEGAAKRRRRFVRWPFRRESVELRVTHPGGNAVVMKVACRNLSAAGVSLLHSSFLHPGSACEVVLPSAAGPARVRGMIVRCQHRSGVVHEIGVRFDEAMPMRDFVGHDLFSDWYSRERVDPATLEGTVVCLMGSPLDQRVLKHFLREAAVRLRIAAGVREAVEAAAHGASLIVCDAEGAEMPPRELVSALRIGAEGIPILMIAADSHRATRERLTGIGLDAVVVRPLSQDTLLRAMAEFLLDVHGRSARGGGEAELREAWDELSRMAAQAESAMRKRDPEPLFGVCFNIRARADRAGLRAVERVADAALRALAVPGESLPEAELESLLRACQRPGREEREPGVRGSGARGEAEKG